MATQFEIFGNFYFELEQGALESDFFGWEFLHGAMRHRLVDKAFRRVRVVFLPMFRASPQFFVAYHNYFAGLNDDGAQRATALVVDWPALVEPHLEKLVESSPQSVALVTSALLDAIAQGGSAHGTTKDDVFYFFESLDLRRYFIKEALTKGLIARLKDVMCSGARSEHIARNAGSYPQFPPTDLALTSGLLPFLKAAFAAVEGTVDEAAADSLGTAIAKRIDEGGVDVIYVCASLENLVSFDSTLRGLETRKEDIGENLVANARAASLAEVRKTRIETAQTKLVRLGQKTVVELALNPGFVSRHLTAKPAHELILSPSLEIASAYAQAFRNTAARYTDWTKMEVSQFQEKNFFRFSHRLARDQGAFFSNTFDTLLAAQAAIDSNFAFELLKECQEYPVNERLATQLPEIEVPLESIFPNVSSVTLRRFETMQKRAMSMSKVKKVKHNKIQKPVSPVSEDKYADNRWVHEDHPFSCSFPEEDIFMEDFAFQCRKQAIEKVKAKETFVTEMQSSFGEGLDIRETVRNWHDQKIMIREEARTGKADVGTIVFNFAEPHDEERFSWKTFWNAEVHDKSHLMFFATPFADNLIGPGIAKSEFGGFAVIPLNAIPINPWDDPFIRAFCQRPSEALIVGGALVTEHKSILYIANHPPESRVTELLKRSGKTIIFMKISELSSEQIRKVRTFHILAEAGVRDYAQKYIRKE